MNLIVGQILRLVALLFSLLANCLLVSWLSFSIPDNEHTFLDMEEKLTKYFPKEWKQDSGKVRQLVSSGLQILMNKLGASFCDPLQTTVRVS